MPELVFINCCHVGARERLQLIGPDSPFLHRYDRPAFAAGVAEALIGLGVRCVIAAGWAVDDRAAELFAVTFYGEILKGARFIEATATARAAAAALGGTTWAAFQCWGDPEWFYTKQTADAQGRTDPVREEIASADALVIVLDTIATQARFDPKDAESEQQGKDRRVRLAELDRRFGRTWEHIGRVADAFGAAYSEIGDLANATEWYGRAIKANDGSASLRAAEQLSNLSVRATWKTVSSVRGGLGLSKADRERLTSATANIRMEIESLEGFIRMRRTMELGSLLGSAHKRLAMVSAKLGDTAAERQACADMQEAYKQAETYGGKDNPEVFYPAWHRLVSDAVAVAGTGKGLNAEDVTFYRGLLARKDEAEQDFWSAVGFVELDLIQAVAAGTLGKETDQLTERFKKVAERVPSRRMWGSVYDNTTFVLDIYRRRLQESPAGKSASNGGTIQQELSAIDGILEASTSSPETARMGPASIRSRRSVRRTRSRQRQKGRRRTANRRVDVLGRHEAAMPRRHAMSIQQFRLASVADS